MVERCSWVGEEPIMRRYHDLEWGVPAHDDRKLFELLILEGAQAGLSWLTVLRRRTAYRKAFFGFDPARVARFTTRRIEELRSDSSIIRHRAKIESVPRNARAFLSVQEAHGRFADYLWAFVDGEPICNRYSRAEQIPTETHRSRALSKDLRRRGFSFVGPVICQAFMQAAGLFNDHLVGCFRHDEV